MSQAPIRVLLADDSPFARRAFRRVLSGAADLEVVGEAGNGAEALAQCQAHSPDVLLLDLGMPVMDGLATLERLNALPSRPAVVVVSASTRKGAGPTLAALEMGAFDFVDKNSVPTMQLHDLGAELQAKIRAAAASRQRTGEAAGSPPPPSFPLPELLVVGASTGGPQALWTMLRSLPAGFPAPVLVVQHIPAAYVRPLAERIGLEAALASCEGTPGERLLPGRIYLAPGGGNAEVVRRGGALILVQRPASEGTTHVPSVDALFLSAARSCGPRAWAVLLTGMGRDGGLGMLEVRRGGGLTVAQDESTCAVFGMPRAAIELGGAYAVLPLHQISAYLAVAAMGARPPSLSHQA